MFRCCCFLLIAVSTLAVKRLDAQSYQAVAAGGELVGTATNLPVPGYEPCDPVGSFSDTFTLSSETYLIQGVPLGCGSHREQIR